MSEIKPMDWALPARMFESEFWVSAEQVMARQQNAKEEIDRLTAERDDALAAADFLEVEMAKFQISADTAMAERDAAVADAERWNELCRQVDLTMFPYSILDDAMAMGAGALELYIDEAMKEQEQGQ